MNEAYFALGSIWLNSLKKVMDEKINTVYIADVGLTKETREYLSLSWDKIEFIDTTTHAVPYRIHDNDWKNAVSEKTRKLLKICNDTNYPIVMMDSDQYIEKDFSEEIYDNCDIQLCKVADEDKPLNQDGYDLGHIGSWFVIHNDKGKAFLKKWIERMWIIEGAHVETPALQLTFTENIGNTKWRINHERVVSAPKHHEETKIIHFRSEGEQPVDLLRRIGNVENLPMPILESILNSIRVEGDSFKNTIPPTPHELIADHVAAQRAENKVEKDGKMVDRMKEEKTGIQIK